MRLGWFGDVRTSAMLILLGGRILMRDPKRNDFTIIMTIYNEHDYLPEAMKMIIKNYKLADYIYISDNCSTDDSVKIVERYVEQYPKIQLFRHKQMMHIAKHSFWLLSQVKTEYVLILRPKNILSENFIRQCLNKLKDSPDAVATYADAYLIGKEQRLALIRGDNFDHADAIYHEVICLESNDVRERVELISRNGGCSVAYHVCRTEALLESMMHVEREESGGDNIIALRMALLGKWVYVGEAKYYYYCRPETWSATALRLRSAGFDVAEINPYWYVPVEFLKLCKLKIPRLFDANMKNRIILNFRLRGMELSDEDWINRHTVGWMTSVIKEKSKGKAVVIFGTGDYAKKTYEKIKSKIVVSFFIDNDKEKWGKEFFSKKICTPQSVQNGDYIVCIASSKYLREMMEQMEGYGYVYFENLFCLAGEVSFEFL